MNFINAYDKATGEFSYYLPYEYTSLQAATERANSLNAYWQSEDRIIKGDKLYTTSEEHHNEVMQAFRQLEQQPKNNDVSLPRRVRRAPLVRTKLS